MSSPVKILRRYGRKWRKKGRTLEDLKTQHGMITDLQSIVEEFKVILASMSEVPGVDTDHCTLMPCDQVFKFERTEEENVQMLLASMDVSKAPGLDSISSRVLKMVTSAISSSLTLLFNFSLLKGQVTSEWKFARVTPVPKKKRLRVC